MYEAVSLMTSSGVLRNSFTGDAQRSLDALGALEWVLVGHCATDTHALYSQVSIARLIIIRNSSWVPNLSFLRTN